MVRGAIAMLAAALLLGGCAGFVRDRIYRPEPLSAQTPPWPGRAPQQVSVTTADGVTLHGYWWPPADGRSDVTVYFHGNGFNHQVGAWRAAPLAAGGHGVLVAGYRGYGDNAGRPSEPGLTLDAEAWMRRARELQPWGRLYLFGHSLGGAVALKMAGAFPVDGVATLGTFSRLAAAAPRLTRAFLPDRWDNRAAIARASAPTTLFHGTKDTVVPFTEAAILHDAAAGRARIVPLEGGGHQIDLAKLAPLVWQSFGEN